MWLTVAAIFSVSSGLGYALPAIIGLESMGVPSPGETALVLAAVLASQGKLQIWLVLVIGISSAIIGDNIGYWLGRRLRPRGARPPAGRCSTTERARSRPATGSSSATATRPCSSAAGSRWCASPRRGWPASTTCECCEFLFWNALGGDHLGADVRPGRLLRRPRRCQRDQQVGVGARDRARRGAGRLAGWRCWRSASASRWVSRRVRDRAPARRS